MVDGDLVEEVKDNNLNHFWSDESYNILYTWKKGNANRYIIYYWQGRDCHMQDKGLAALLINKIVRVVKLRSGEPMQKRVIQMSEPVHFHYIFKNRFVVHRGKQFEPTSNFAPCLYHVRGFSDVPWSVKAVEVNCTATVLSPQDVFILHTPAEQWIWIGSGSPPEYKDIAVLLCGEISKVKKTSHVGEPLYTKQGQELNDFWAAMPGGRKPHSDSRFLNKKIRTRLYECSSASGTFSVNEIFYFSQVSLLPDMVYIVDGIHEVYVWCGPWCTQTDTTEAMKVAVEYVEKASDGRLQSTPVRRIEAGREPPEFACLFHAWKGETSGEQGGENVLDILKEMNRTYTYNELVPNPPKGLDGTRLESYLSDEEFFKIFERTKEDFYALPEWIRLKKRQEVGLY